MIKYLAFAILKCEASGEGFNHMVGKGENV